MQRAETGRSASAVRAVHGQTYHLHCIKDLHIRVEMRRRRRPRWWCCDRLNSLGAPPRPTWARPLEGVLNDVGDVASHHAVPDDLAVLADNKYCRQRPDAQSFDGSPRSVGIGPGDIQTFHERAALWQGVGPFRREADEQNITALQVFLEFDEANCLGTAGASPMGPHIHDGDAPQQVFVGDRWAVDPPFGTDRR